MDKLRSKSDFERVYARGRRANAKHVVVITVPGAAAQSRVGLVAGKKVGKAHDRMRAKRRLREVWRRVAQELSSPLDVVIIARPSAVRAGFAELCADVRRGIERSCARRDEAATS